MTNADFSAMSAAPRSNPGVKNGKDMAPKAKGKKGSDDEAGLAFSSLISQSMQTYSNSQNAVKKDNDSLVADWSSKASQNGSPGRSQGAKDTKGSSKSFQNPPTESASSQPAKNNDTMPMDDDAAERASEVLSEISDGIRHEIVNALDISEDDFDEAMEILAVSVMDLLNPHTLEDVALQLNEISGIDGIAPDEVPGTVEELISGIDEMIGESLNENSISLEEFTGFLDLASDGEIELPPELAELLPKQNVGNDSAEATSDGSEYADLPIFRIPEGANGMGIEGEPAVYHGLERTDRTEQKLQQNAAGGGVQVISISDEDLEQQPQADDADADESMIAASGMEQNTAGSKGSEDMSGGGDRNPFNDRTGAKASDIPHSSRSDAAPLQQPQQSSFAQTLSEVTETTTTYTTAQTREIIDQIVTRAQAVITDTVSRMEIELNPQSLGRMIMQVQEQEGVVTAKLIAQNENVKEALSTQMAQLRESLEARGIKVDAIEVAVGTHEFERNLEEGFAGQFNQNEGGENAARSRGRREGGIGGILAPEDEISDEEIMKEAIRRDSGTTVEYQA